MRNTASLMSPKNRQAAVRWLAKHQPFMLKSEIFVRALRLGLMSKQAVYGYHPTKGRKKDPNRTQVKLQRKQSCYANSEN